MFTVNAPISDAAFLKGTMKKIKMRHQKRKPEENEK